jgi:hypothetical protein
MGAIKKAGVQFFAKIDTNRDLIGAAAQFSAEVVVDADGSILTDASANASIGAFAEVGSTGIYRAPITLTDEGDYTISVKWTDGSSTEYIPFPVEVKAADMSDLKTLIDALQADMTSVKTQVDVLDEAELNGIAEQVTTVEGIVTNIKTLIDDEDGATVNSVMEFVEAINNALSAGGSSLSALAGYTDNLELMLEGKAYTDTEGNAVSEEDSKGLAEIFAAITSNGTDIATANAAITALQTSVNTQTTTITDAITASQTAVETAITNAKDSIETNVAAVKTVVDANAAILGDAVFGNEAIKNLIVTADAAIDALAARFDDGGDVEVRFDAIDSAIANIDADIVAAQSAIETAIANQTATLEGRFDTVDAALANISGAQQYKGFV